MTSRDDIIRRLRENRDELQAAGIQHAALFGSIARDEATDDSDIDLVVDIAPDSAARGFAYFGRLERLRGKLAALLGHDVDLVVTPVRKPHLRTVIERDRVNAF